MNISQSTINLFTQPFTYVAEDGSEQTCLNKTWWDTARRVEIVAQAIYAGVWAGLCVGKLSSFAISPIGGAIVGTVIGLGCAVLIFSKLTERARESAKKMEDEGIDHFSNPFIYRSSDGTEKTCLNTTWYDTSKKIALSVFSFDSGFFLGAIGALPLEILGFTFPVTLPIFLLGTAICTPKIFTSRMEEEKKRALALEKIEDEGIDHLFEPYTFRNQNGERSSAYKNLSARVVQIGTTILLGLPFSYAFFYCGSLLLGWPLGLIMGASSGLTASGYAFYGSAENFRRDAALKELKANYPEDIGSSYRYLSGEIKKRLSELPEENLSQEELLETISSFREKSRSLKDSAETLLRKIEHPTLLYGEKKDDRNPFTLWKENIKYEIKKITLQLNCLEWLDSQIVMKGKEDLSQAISVFTEISKELSFYLNRLCWEAEPTPLDTGCIRAYFKFIGSLTESEEENTSALQSFHDDLTSLVKEQENTATFDLSPFEALSEEEKIQLHAWLVNLKNESSGTINTTSLARLVCSVLTKAIENPEIPSKQLKFRELLFLAIKSGANAKAALKQIYMAWREVQPLKKVNEFHLIEMLTKAGMQSDLPPERYLAVLLKQYSETESETWFEEEFGQERKPGAYYSLESA